MNFEEFINTIKDTIKEYLPEDYRDAEVNILENRKLNTNYTGLTVTREGDTLAPTINLNNLFDSYSKHPEHSITAVMQEVASVIQHDMKCDRKIFFSDMRRMLQQILIFFCR